MPVYHLLTNERRKQAYREGDFELDPRSPFAQGLIGFWPLGVYEGSTDFDHSVRGNHGTRTNGPTRRITQRPKLGAIRALDFDGTDDYVDVGAGVGEGDTATFSVWLNPRPVDPSPSTQRDPFFARWQNNTSDRSWQIRQGDDNNVPTADDNLVFFWSADGLSNNNVEWDGALKLDVWQHVVIVFNRGAVAGYVDGRNLGTPDHASGSAASLFSANTNTVMGRAMNGGIWNYYAGEIAEALIHNRELPAAEIAEMYDHPELLIRPRSHRSTFAFSAAGDAFPFELYYGGEFV